MYILILSSRFGKKTANKLKETFITKNHCCLVYTSLNALRQAMISWNFDAVINWGYSEHLEEIYSNDLIIINSKLYLSKYKQKQRLIEMNVPIPSILKPQKAIKVFPHRSRLNRRHFMSWGNEANEGSRDFSWVEEFFPKDREFRVFIVGNKCKIREKLGGNIDQISWNYGISPITYHVLADEDLKTRLKELGIKAIKALNYDCGAVDIGYRSDLEQLKVFEVNSAPALTTDAGLEWYADKLIELIDKKRG